MADAYGETQCCKCARTIHDAEGRWIDMSPDIEEGPDGNDIVVESETVATCVDCKPPPEET